MLRTDNGRALEYSSNIKYAPTSNKCLSSRKPVCHSGFTDLEKMRNFHRQNACATYSCTPQKSCMAKVGQHANGQYLTPEFIGKNITPNLRTGGNQIGYVYQEKTIGDPDALMNALRSGNYVHNTATKLAQHNSELYGKDTNWDGTASGFFCVKCPPKPKPCPPASKCKKNDPFNEPVGLGSNVVQATESLRENNLARVFRQRETLPEIADLNFNMSDLPEMKEMGVQATGTVPFKVDERVRTATKRGPAQPRKMKESGVGMGAGAGDTTTRTGARERDGL